MWLNHCICISKFDVAQCVNEEALCNTFAKPYKLTRIHIDGQTFSDAHGATTCKSTQEEETFSAGK